MVEILSFFIGFLSGLLYNEHIYRQSRRSQGSGYTFGFLLRLSFVALLGIIVALRFGSMGVLLFFAGNLVARIIHTLVRGVLIVRY